MESYQAQLLVATPQLPDGNFFRSVVFLIHHDDEGAFGVVLNRPTNFQLKEVWHAITKKECELNASIYIGGPVDGPLLAIHDQPHLSETEIMDGVYITSEKDNLEGVFGCQEGQCKIFSGYAGWGPGQLEQEVEIGSWFLAPATESDVFSIAEDLWEQIVGKIGKKILFPNADPDFEAFDASLN